jgi:peptide/nickel transport system permease protein
VTRFRDVLRQFRRRRLSLFALAVLLFLGAVAVLADELASDKPIAVRVDGQTWIFPNHLQPSALANENIQSLEGRAEWMVPPLIPFGPHQLYTVQPQPASAPPWPPDADHLLGTDENGRDVLARLIHGARISLTVGFVAVAIYVLIGLFLGALAGFYGRLTDAVISRFIETMMAFPTLFLVLCVLGVTRPRNIFPVIAVIGLTRWTDVARLVRGEVLKLKTLDYVQASRALGASDARIIFRHLLPNAMGPVLVAATFGVAGAILIESTLSFLGMGVPPPTASWGELLTQAHRYVTYPGAWWLTLYPGLAIFVTITAFNLVGEGLRDALDPRLK